MAQSDRQAGRSLILSWWSDHPEQTARQVRSFFLGAGQQDLPAGFQVPAPPTLRQWKARAKKRVSRVAPGGSAAAVWVSADQVHPWPDNPRDNDHAIPAVAKSIARFGYGRAFVGWRPDEGAMLVVGHTARKATLLLLDAPPVYAWQLDGDAVACTTCKRPLGRAHIKGCPVADIPGTPARGLIPIRWRPEWTEEEARAYAIADNQLGSIAEWAPDTLADQLRDLHDHDLTVQMLGWTDHTLDSLLSELGPSDDLIDFEPTDGEDQGDLGTIATYTCPSCHAEHTLDELRRATEG